MSSFLRIHRVTGVTEYPALSAFAEPANKLTKMVYQSRSEPRISSDSNTFNLVQQNLFTRHLCLVLFPNKPWNKIILETIDHLISAGIAQGIEYKESPDDKREDDLQPDDLKPLTMDHLGVCFIIIAICWALSIVVFAGELVTKLAGDANGRRQRRR